MYIKLAGDATFLHKAMLLIKMDRGKVINANTQVDLANRADLPGPINKMREHISPDPQAPVFAQDSYPKFTSMADTSAFARAKMQRSRDFAPDLGYEIDTGG